MRKTSENSLSRLVSDCNYNSNYRIMFCLIKYIYFYNNNHFAYYNYIIDNEYILDDENNHQLTFVSNKLSDSSFKCEFLIKDASFIKVNIININCNFYLKLLSEVGYYIIINGENDSSINILKRNDYVEEFNIIENSCSLNFLIQNGNYDLDINYLKRKNYVWEGDMGQSIYYYFNHINEGESHIHNNTIFQVEPIFFFYNDFSLQKDSFKLNITFKDQVLSLVFKIMPLFTN